MRRFRTWPKPSERSKSPLVRQPVVAGVFYPEEKGPLAELIDQFVGRNERKQRLLGMVVPHGGYLNSGEVAGLVYSSAIWPRRVVVMGPNHTGAGRQFSLMRKGVWETPLGRLPVDKELAKAILDQVPELEEDPKAHEEEHAIEVQIPFLQRVGNVDSFVPILFQSADAATAQRIGQGIAQAIAQVEEDALLIATTDLTRYETKEIAQENDRRAMERILALDGPGLLKTVESRSISMCGPVPTAVTIAAVKSLGASKAVLVRYQTQGGSPGEAASVVGFAGITFR